MQIMDKNSEARRSADRRSVDRRSEGRRSVDRRSGGRRSVDRRSDRRSSDRRSEGRRSVDHRSESRRPVDRRSEGRGSVDRRSVDRRSEGRRSADRRSVDRRSLDRRSEGRRAEDRRSRDRRSEGRRSSDRRSEEQEYEEEGYYENSRSEDRNDETQEYERHSSRDRGSGDRRSDDRRSMSRGFEGHDTGDGNPTQGKLAEHPQEGQGIIIGGYGLQMTLAGLHATQQIIISRLKALEDKNDNKTRPSDSRSSRHRSRARSRQRSNKDDSSYHKSNNKSSRSRSQIRSRERNSRTPFNPRVSESRYKSPYRDNNRSRSPKKRARSESGDDSDRSRSRNPSVKRSRNDSPSKGQDVFRYKGETYIKFKRDKHRHVPNRPDQIFWDNELQTVKWLDVGSSKAFCQIKTHSSKKSPYMEKASVCSTFENFFDLTPVAGETFPLKKSGYSVPFGTDTGLGKALELFTQPIGGGQSPEEAVIQALRQDNKKSALKAFPEQHFDNPAIFVFSKDWPKGDQYMEWAKGALLDHATLSDYLNVDNVNKEKLQERLEEERDSKNILTTNITGIKALELLAEKSIGDTSMQNAIYAIARLFLSNLKPLTVNWMDAKTKLRQSILHNQDTEAVRVLLKSNMWLPNIFPKETLEEVKDMKKDSGLRSVLNLNADGSLKQPPQFTPKWSNNGNSKKKNEYQRSQSRGTQFNQRKKENNNSFKTKESFRTTGNGNTSTQKKAGSTQNAGQKGKYFPKGKNKQGGGKPRQ